MLHSENYREILKHELKTRSAKNKKYSLRSFARFLDLQPTTLSFVLNGKRGLSKKSALSIATKLQFTEDQIKYFVTLVEASQNRTKPDKKIKASLSASEQLSRLKKHQLTPKDYREISHPNYFVLLQLLKIKKYRNDLEALSTKMGVEKNRLNSMIALLCKTGLVRKTEKTFEVIHESVTSPDGISNISIRKAQEFVLDRAKLSLRKQKVEDRDFFATIMRFEKSNLEEVRSKIRRFFSKLEYQYGSVTSEEVYCLSMQTFNINSGANK